MTSPFARVEPMEQAVEHGVPYYKLIAANMVVADGFSEEELLEMAIRLDEAVNARVRPLVEALEKIANIECARWQMNGGKKCPLAEEKWRPYSATPCSTCLARKALEEFRK